MPENIRNEGSEKKVYFGEKNPKADEKIREHGWTYASDELKSDEDIIRLEIPDNLQAVRLEPLIAWSDVGNYLVWDPDLAHVEIVKLAALEGNKRWQELNDLGYKVIDSNIGRTIFVKSKIQMH